MSDEKDVSVVFRTSQPDEAPALAARLFEAGIPFEVRIAVQASREKEAVALIEGYMQSIGAAPNEEKPAEEAGAEELLPCPNCEAVGIVLRRPCAGCGFMVLKAAAPPVPVREHTPSAKTFCPECRELVTFASGKCGTCGEELEPLEGGDRLCPELTHVLYRDTVGGSVCKACERVWIDVAP